MHAHRLALGLGCFVSDIRERMSPKEFVDWEAYYQLEPWGAWRSNRDVAQIAALMYNIHRGKGTPAAHISDYIYEDPALTAEKQAQKFIATLKGMARSNKDGG